MLTQALQLKKIAFQEGVFEERAAPASADERFDADVALATGELSGLIVDLLAALGGEVDPGQPSGFTEAPTPASTVTEEATVSADDPPF
ncbi:hypothetical protein MASR1M50_30010 [Burkholderiales bacterium]